MRKPTLVNWTTGELSVWRAKEGMRLIWEGYSLRLGVMSRARAASALSSCVAAAPLVVGNSASVSVSPPDHGHRNTVKVLLALSTQIHNLDPSIVVRAGRLMMS